MEMKAILLSDYSEPKVQEVFTPGVVMGFRRFLDLPDGTVHSGDVLGNPAAYHGVEVLLTTWGIPCFTKSQIDGAFPNLKAIFHCAGTVQHFALPYLDNGVKIYSAWRANAVPVAEATVAQILLANKGLFSAYRMRHQHRHSYQETNDFCFQFSGNYRTRVGLLGAGTIGRRVVEMLKPFGMEILVFDPYLTSQAAAELGVEKTDLETVFGTCRVVSNHLADKPDIKGLIDERLFRLMPPYSTFINTGRGAQVKETDLARVFGERPDLIALLDVTWPEPPLPDSPLHTLENVFLSPHVTGGISSEFGRITDYMLSALESYLADQPSEHQVTREMLAHMA